MRCADDRRRAVVRAAGRNGIDAVQVCADRRELVVIFFGKIPEELGPRNFRIEGGRRVTDIAVVGVQLGIEDDPELEDRVRLRVDREGDLSTYRLCVVDVPDFDPRYTCLDFRFVTGCDDLDCAPPADCPPEPLPRIEIDYLAKDYASFRQLLLDRMSLIMPQWTERHIPDIGIALVELLAYEGDRLSYQQDAVATEAYLDTARLRTSVRRHARLVDYTMHDGCAARAWVCLEVSANTVLPTDRVRFASGSRHFLPIGSRQRPLYRAHNRIDLWTWGDHDCCLPVGATSATLIDGAPYGDRMLRLEPGDVLIFEELIGARTGLRADADRTHRQAVRITSVTETDDPLYRQPLVEVTWSAADALRFPLCVNARGGRDCTDLVVGVARGNIVLVEHGEPVTQELLPPIAPQDEPGCPDPVCFGCAEAASTAARPPYPPLPLRFRPRLNRRPVTRHTAYPLPENIARAQAEWLRGLPDRARLRLARILRKASDGGVSDADIAYLTAVFGADTLWRAHFPQHSVEALRFLIARFDQLLAPKLARVRRLERRALGGDVLTAANEGWELGQLWGAREGEAIDPARPALHGPAAAALFTDPRRALPAVEVERGDEKWCPRIDLLDSAREDRHFVGESDDDGFLWLRFGDGRIGAIFEPLAEPPKPNDRKTVAKYRVGNGIVGNVGAEAIDRIIGDGVEDVVGIRNPLAAGGGIDPESVADTRALAPHEARLRQLRAVTAEDYAALAGRTVGVQRAVATLAWTGSWYEAQVGIDALGTGFAPEWLLDEVRGRLHRYRRIGHDLSIASARPVPLDLALCVEVLPDHIAGHVRAALLRVLGSGRDGFFHPDRLTFGTPVRVSRIIAAAAAVPGVRRVEITRLERLFGPFGKALDTGVLPIRPLEVPQLDNDPTRPENGRLRLDLVGGR